MSFYQPFADHQSQSQSHGRHGGILQPFEWLEQARLLLDRYPDSLVADAYNCFVVPLVRGNLYLGALSGILDRIEVDGSDNRAS